MKILLVAATRLEVEPILKRLQKTNDLEYTYHAHQIEPLITGVGMMATAYHLTKKLQNHSCDLVLNIGICGAFDRSLELTELIWVRSDLAAEEGAEFGEEWLSLSEMKLREPNEFPYENNKLVADIPSALKAKLPHKGVDAISVNRVLGNEASIDKMLRYFDAAVESMEGAAVYYSCRMQGLACLQLRAVSNYVENRDRSSWKIEEALTNLADGTLKLLADAEA